MTTTKETLNGYEFVATYRPKQMDGILPGRIIMGKRETNTVPRGAEYVTAYLPDDDSSWQFGHYFDNETEAKSDYWHRIERGM